MSLWTRVSAVTLLTLSLTACAMQIPTQTPGRQEVLVSQSLDQAYVRGQRTAWTLGLTITESHDLAHMFAAQRASGERLQVRVEPLGFGSLVTVVGLPPHDVSDFLAAYKQGR